MQVDLDLETRRKKKSGASRLYIQNRAQEHPDQIPPGISANKIPTRPHSHHRPAQRARRQPRREAHHHQTGGLVRTAPVYPRTGQCAAGPPPLFASACLCLPAASSSALGTRPGSAGRPHEPPKPPPLLSRTTNFPLPARAVPNSLYQHSPFPRSLHSTTTSKPASLTHPCFEPGFVQDGLSRRP